MKSDTSNLIIGSYQLLSIRSRLNNCQVWTGLHRPTEMEVVVEVYPKSGDDKALIESIVHKMGRFTQLAECRVLRLLEAMDLEDAILLVYEYYSSQSLLQYAVNCPINGVEFRRLVRSLIRTVQRLHSRCFFHGTLSVDSFVLTKQKKIRFKDAASCHLFVKSDVEPSRLDAMLSKASDVWSLGTIVYRLISHQLDSVLGEADAFDAVVRAMNSDLADLLSRMTEQNPTARISTVECLRHVYLTHGDPLASVAAARKLNSTSTPAVNRDVIRFLHRATGAPEADLAAAAVANDLSGWCAAYWLLRQRIIAGRGFPYLSEERSVLTDETDEQRQTNLNEVKDSLGTSVDDAKSQPQTVQNLEEQRWHSQSKAQSKRQQKQFHRDTIQLLRTRRLGLRSPEPSARLPQPQTSSSGGVRVAAFQTNRSRDEPLPPIGVRSASQSQSSRALAGIRGQQQQQQQQQQSKLQQQQQSGGATARRYLVYMRGGSQEAVGGGQAVTSRELPTVRPTSPGAVMDAGSGIWVRVQTRSTQQRPAHTSESAQKQQNQQPLAMLSPRAPALPQQPSVSPRQPPNSPSMSAVQARRGRPAPRPFQLTMRRQRHGPIWPLLKETLSKRPLRLRPGHHLSGRTPSCAGHSGCSRGWLDENFCCCCE